MALVQEPIDGIARREPDVVMRLARLGSMHQSRLSFMRILIRRMRTEGWTFSRPIFEIDNKGVGHALICAHGGLHTYSLLAFFHDLPDDLRSDRVIAKAWDATFTLFDGMPEPQDIRRLSLSVPLQEAGRVSESELSLSRANRSVRLWQQVVDSLSQGRQPDMELIRSVGYLMRTTAVYGSGKFGAADREMICDRAEFAAPFQVEMLSVYLIRVIVRDLVQHVADSRGAGKSVKLDPAIARCLGIGNSTGLGMAPFLLNHPLLFNNWIMAREEAIARIRSIPTADQAAVDILIDVLARSNELVRYWNSQHEIQQQKLKALRADIVVLKQYLATQDLLGNYPWNSLYVWAETHLSLEGQEYVASLILEPYAELVDGLAQCMSDAQTNLAIDGQMSLTSLRNFIDKEYDWALSIDWDAPESTSQLWYLSAQKQEPRLADRHAQALGAYEQPLAPARDVVQARRHMDAWPADATVAEFVLQHPEYRHVVRRVQLLQWAPYAEIRDNTIARLMLPIDLLRCKLAFFGATCFDPRSDRWVRVCLFANAPFPEELKQHDARFWPYPPLAEDAGQ